MKAVLNFRFVLLCISACICSLNMYGQWDDYSSHTNGEYHNNSRSIYLRGNPSTDLDGFEILTKILNEPVFYDHIFQMNSRGRIAFGPPAFSDSYACLDFLQQTKKIASINTAGKDFHVDADYKLWFSSKGHTSFIIDDKNIDISGNLNISVPGLTPNAKISICNGANNTPTLSCNASNKYLQIGNDGGLALFGDDTYKQTTAIPTLKIVKDWVSIKGNFKLVDGDVISYMGTNKASNTGWIGTTSNHGLFIGANNNAEMYIDQGQRVYIGFKFNQVTAIRRELKEKYKLFVAKGVLAEDYSIAPINSWSDYVFSKYYKLRQLGDVEKFIEKNKHLPDVPSATEVAEKGYSQHEMNKMLLQKIEELTLYTIEQEKKIEKLEGELNALHK